MVFSWQYFAHRNCLFACFNSVISKNIDDERDEKEQRFLIMLKFIVVYRFYMILSMMTDEQIP